MQIVSHYSRDNYLHELYAKKELLVFLNGIDWFNQQINEIWNAYYDHVKMPNKFKNFEMDKSKWEHHNL